MTNELSLLRLDVLALSFAAIWPSTILPVMYNQATFIAMSTVKEIKWAITQLDPKDVQAVADWLQEYREELWDRQIEADAKAGRLDMLMEEAKQDYQAGRCKPLP